MTIGIGTTVIETGVRVWFQGQVWSCQEVDSSGVVLGSGGRLTRLSWSTACQAMVIEADAEPFVEEVPAAVVWSSLTADQRRVVEARSAELSAIEEAVAAGAPLSEVLVEHAARLRVSVRTLERRLATVRVHGPAGLTDSRLTRRRSARMDARWDEVCLEVLRRFTAASTPTQGALIAAVERDLVSRYGPGEVPLPHRATAYRRLKELSKGRHAFGSGKQRRSVANRPTGPYGRLRATRPSEYVVLDTTPLDVFAMEPVSLRWVPVELTVAQDLFTRCILGLRVTPVSTRAADVANVLYQCVAPRGAKVESSSGVWPFHGVPRNVLIGTETADGVSQERVGGVPACLPESVVVDHGRVYLSAHVVSACARLGISVQPAVPYKPTDKPTVERFFKTLRESLLQHLPAYKGPDVFSRGEGVEGQAFLYVTELEQIIREWVGTVYHHTKHSGLAVPEIPGASFSPAEMFEIGLAKAGGLVVPARPGLAFEFLDVAWRTIQHYGVDVGGLRYDGAALNLWRNRRSSYGGAHAGKWPIFVDSGDVRFVYFQDPETHEWHRLAWEHTPGLGQPFSADALAHAKQVALRSNRHLDPHQAVHDLLSAWSRGEVESRRDRSLARRLAAQRAADSPIGSEAAEGEQQGAVGAGEDAAREVASLPGVVDLLTRRRERDVEQQVEADLDDVFARYYAQHPDSDGLEVFDE